VNSLDIVIVVILSFSVVHSLFRGFIKEVFFLVSIVLGFLCASHLYHHAADALRPHIQTEPLRNIIGFTSVFLICSTAVSLLGNLIRKLVKEVKLGWLDHLLGLFSGILKGVAFASILTMVLVTFLPPNARITSESRLAPEVISITKAIVALTPSALREQFDSKMGELKKLWNRRDIGKTLQGVIPQLQPSPVQPKKP
jgi:membrane protein required for colicin V production